MGSRCFLESKRLASTTCHDPHEEHAPEAMRGTPSGAPRAMPSHGKRVRPAGARLRRPACGVACGRHHSGHIPRGPSGNPGSGDTHFYRWDVVFGIKSGEGSVILFQHSTELRGDVPQNSSFNKQGNNKTVKENFAAFAKKHEWHAHSYITPIMPAGTSGGGGSNVGQDILNGFESVIGVVGPALLALL